VQPLVVQTAVTIPRQCAGTGDRAKHHVPVTGSLRAGNPPRPLAAFLVAARVLPAALASTVSG
jgi:hypothetical protein